MNMIGRDSFLLNEFWQNRRFTMINQHSQIAEFDSKLGYLQLSMIVGQA